MLLHHVSSFVAKDDFYCIWCCSGKDWPTLDGGDAMDAAWLYVQYLLGIPHDDCDYDKLLLQLAAKLKAYIKLIVCFPHRIFDKEFQHISEAVFASDLVRLIWVLYIPGGAQKVEHNAFGRSSFQSSFGNDLLKSVQ